MQIAIKNTSWIIITVLLLILIIIIIMLMVRDTKLIVNHKQALP